MLCLDTVGTCMEELVELFVSNDCDNENPPLIINEANKSGNILKTSYTHT